MSLSSQIAKYDYAAIRAAISDLNSEIADESIVAVKLIENEPVERLEAAKKFIKDNSADIEKAHADLTTKTSQLAEMIQSNKLLEEADFEYKSFLDSPEAKSVARQLIEIHSMISGYRDLLLKTGRVGRPTDFEDPADQ